MNYFDRRYTNAFTESVNSLIRELDRVGRGSFEIMRARLLFPGGTAPQEDLDA